MLGDNLDFGKNLVKAELKSITDQNDLLFSAPSNLSNQLKKQNDFLSNGYESAWSKPELT
ncbi:MAG: hypothetical protein NXI23_21900 [Bacteroidetes bacterium]|jgi:hypothetical protein|nr:hypothetical protein [Bacteroidota bacterium]MDF1863579.1 hypothetical protein [Saprospiraceae bacterium]